MIEDPGSTVERSVDERNLLAPRQRRPHVARTTTDFNTGEKPLTILHTALALPQVPSHCFQSSGEEMRENVESFLCGLAGDWCDAGMKKLPERFKKIYQSLQGLRCMTARSPYFQNPQIVIQGTNLYFVKRHWRRFTDTTPRIEHFTQFVSTLLIINPEEWAFLSDIL